MCWRNQSKGTRMKTKEEASIAYVAAKLFNEKKHWVGLTKEEIAEFDTWHDNREEEVGWCNPSEIVA